MPGSATSVFSEAEDFEAALRKEGYLGLLVTGQGAFRARLTQIALHRLRISAGEEQLPRIALADLGELVCACVDAASANTLSRLEAEYRS